MTLPARPVGGRPVPPVAAVRRTASRTPAASDTNEVMLVGAVVRPPRFLEAEGRTEFTVAGHTPSSSGKILPWYHKVLVEREIGETLVAGMPVEVVGQLDHHKFTVPGVTGIGQKTRSVIRVIAEQVSVLDRASHPVSEIPTPTGETSFILDGGSNRVRLAGNLSQNAEQFRAPGGDPYARIQLAIEGKRRGKKKKNFFLLKAWREQVEGVGELRAGARLGVIGVLLSERYLDGNGVMRNAVLVEIISSKTRE